MSSCFQFCVVVVRWSARRCALMIDKTFENIQIKKKKKKKQKTKKKHNKCRPMHNTILQTNNLRRSLNHEELRKKT